MFKVFVFALIFFSSNVAVSQSVEIEYPAMELYATATAEAPKLVAPTTSSSEQKVEQAEPETVDLAAKFLQWLAAIYLLMWGLGEGLTRISVWTENKWDNKLAALVSQVTWFIGAFAGRMGWKLPKLVIEHEAEKIADKKAFEEKK